jgi:hypothetical protein
MSIRRPWTWLALAGALGVIVFRLFWPQLAGLMPPCMVHGLTGLHCPGCGGTRCVARLFCGDLAGAFAMNALVVLIGLVTAVVISRGIWREWKGGSHRIFPSWLAWSIAALVIVFGLARNLPWWPFTLLVPVEHHRND